MKYAVTLLSKELFGRFDMLNVMLNANRKHKRQITSSHSGPKSVEEGT